MSDHSLKGELQFDREPGWQRRQRRWQGKWRPPTVMTAMKFPSISKLSCSSFVSFVFDQFSAAVFGTPIHSGQFVFILITCSHHVFHFTLETQLLQVSRLYIGSFVSTLKSAYNVLENLFWFVTSVLDDAASFPEVLTAISCWYSTTGLLHGLRDCSADFFCFVVVFLWVSFVLFSFVPWQLVSFRAPVN